MDLAPTDVSLTTKYPTTVSNIFVRIRRSLKIRIGHSAANPGHTFQWKILALASSWIFRRTLEALFIVKLRPNLNKKVHSFHPILFPNGIT